jgi:hypothetical protein
MRKKNQDTKDREKETKKRTPTFLLELPLQVSAGQATRLRAHLEAGRQFYNAVLSEGLKRLRAMRADPAWQAARAIPRSQKQERSAAFSHLREQYGFSEYALHEAGKILRVSWLAEHLDAVVAQTLASRAYQALNRVCLGQAKRVRFRSRSRGLSSMENKRNDTGLRFELQQPEEGNQGVLVWKDDRLAALIDWKDPVVKHGLGHRIKYARSGAGAKPAVQRRGGLILRAIATLCNSLWKAFPITSRSIPLGKTSSERTWVPPRLPWSREKQRRVSRSSVRS